jgi:OmpA-OmpF porin, OOP family
MKQIALCISLFLMVSLVQAQFNPIERARERAKQKAQQKLDQKVDQTVDKAMDPALDPKKKNKNAKDSTVKGKDGTGGETGTKIGKPSLETYSRFDFVPGEKVILFEDYSKDNIGDFPDKWNTNGSGEIVTVNKTEGRFLMTRKEVVMYPEWVKDLPDNFTLEFDLMCTDQFSYYSDWFVVGFTTSADVGKNFRSFAKFGNGRIENGGGFEIGFDPENAGGLQYFQQTGSIEKRK